MLKLNILPVDSRVGTGIELLQDTGMTGRGVAFPP